MKKLFITLLIMSLTAFTACDDDDSSSAMSQASFIEQAPELMCASIQECCTEADAWTNTNYTDYSDCIVANRDEMTEDFSEGRYTINESNLGSAYSTLEGMLKRQCSSTVTEDDMLKFVVDYMTAFEGAQAVGEVCEDDSECSDSTNYCYSEGDSDAGVCAVPLNVDEACLSGQACVGTAYCDYDWETETGVCSDRVGLGGDCAGGKLCEEDSYCKDGVCAAPTVAGDACADLEEYPNCYGGSDLWCDVEAGTCADSLPTGGECTFDDMCQSYECDTETSTCLGDDEDTTVEEWVCSLDN